MASNCEDVSAQMMELLYGELPADARATVDAHVAGCARCRAELDGFEKTRALARRGLDEAPPARVHAAIMQAAAAHLATQAQPAAAARQPSAPEKSSFWDWLRARWTFPTLATVGAVAVFLVANRVFLNPERTLERPAVQAHVPESPPLERAPVPSSIGEPAATAEPKAPEPREADDGERQERRRGPAGASAHGSLDEGGDLRGAGKKMKKAEAPRFAEAPPAKAGGRADEKQKSDRDQAAEYKFAPPPPPRDGAPAARVAKEADKAPLREQAEAPKMDAPRSSVPARRAAPAIVAAPAPAQGIEDLLSAGSQRPGGGGSLNGKGALGGVAAVRNKSDGYGSGGAQPAAAAPRPTANEASRAPATASSASAPAAPPPPPAPAKSRAKSAPVAGAADEDYEAAPEAAAKDEKKAATNVSANDALMQRADRLFAEGRWAEAAAIYRELLKRDPRGDDAERWRRRLVAAENAENAERRANAAAKRAAPPAEAESAPRAAKPSAKAAAKPAKASAAAADSTQ